MDVSVIFSHAASPGLLHDPGWPFPDGGLTGYAVDGGGFMPFGGGTVPGAQPPAAVAEGAQFIVPSGAGVAAGVVVFAGVVVSVEGAGVGVLGVTTPGVVVLGLTAPGRVVPGVPVAAGVPAGPVAVCAPAASVESIVHATAKQAIAKKAPP